MVDINAPDIDAGRALVQELDNRRFPLPDAFWLLSQEEKEWRLVLGTSFIDWYGPISAYEELQNIIRSARLSLPLVLLSVVSSSAPLIVALSSAITTGPEATTIRFSRNTIDGVYIEDAVIYRLIPSKSWGMLLEMKGGWKGADPLQSRWIEDSVREELHKWISVTEFGLRTIRARPAFYEVEADPSLNPRQIKKAVDAVAERIYPGRQVTAKILEPPPSRKPVA